MIIIIIIIIITIIQGQFPWQPVCYMYVCSQLRISAKLPGPGKCTCQVSEA